MYCSQWPTGWIPELPTLHANSCDRHLPIGGWQCHHISSCLSQCWAETCVPFILGMPSACGYLPFHHTQHSSSNASRYGKACDSLASPCLWSSSDWHTVQGNPSQSQDHDLYKGYYYTFLGLRSWAQEDVLRPSWAYHWSPNSWWAGLIMCGQSHARAPRFLVPCSIWMSYKQYPYLPARQPFCFSW